jgi:intracellular septation protein A
MSDLIGVVLFFWIFNIYGLWNALMVITFWEGGSLLIELKKKGVITPCKGIFFGLSIFSISLSFFSNNPLFFQIKTSFIYVLLSALMIYYKKTQKKSILKLLCSWNHIELTDGALVFEKYIIGYLLGSAVINTYVALNCTMSTWFYTKMSMGIGLALLIAAMLFQSERHIKNS